MRLITLILGGVLFITALTGCSAKDTQEPIEVTTGQAVEVPFTDGDGRLTVAYNENQIIDLLVLVKELDPIRNYSINFVKDEQVILIFGPEENVDIKLGKIDGETNFIPNSKGELFVSMKNPERLFLEANELKLVIKEKESEVIVSAPFIIKR